MVHEALPSLRSAILAMEVPPIALVVDMFATEAFAVAEELMMMNERPLLIPGCESICFVDCFEPFLKRNEGDGSLCTHLSNWATGEDVEPGLRSEVLNWLSKQPKGSVIYVSIGSDGTLSAEQTIELVWGLEKSQQRFI
ncbi:hypothetical protein F3Y22_tig00110813pilonHSYRG00072 [Hibiscus syriacus]|uniref:Uncharacterized protein n=1 Tax=Hibiscus syriacus TaxID=106335 RepID=A0A6A2ZMQ6_HIBSY|nr:hypothetical protein F3Y22_tig00110813pilonHSYRG00072 [Hibiscus syriacus]